MLGLGCDGGALDDRRAVGVRRQLGESRAPTLRYVVQVGEQGVDTHPLQLGAIAVDVIVVLLIELLAVPVVVDELRKLGVGLWRARHIRHTPHHALHLLGVRG